MFSVFEAQPLHPAFRLPEPFTLRADGAAVALTGPNGGGKTTLGRIIAGALPLRSGKVDYACPRNMVRFVSFRDAWGNALPAAHQLRWHHGEEVESPTVAEFLRLSDVGKQYSSELEGLMDKPLHWLSSGELRKVHLAKALGGDARLAVIDEPYIGLDARARGLLTDFLYRLSQVADLVLLVADERDIPHFVSQVARVEGLRCRLLPAWRPADGGPVGDAETRLPDAAGATSEEVVSLRDVSVSYFGKPILRHVDWTVRRGERWALTGSNGAGKSTLLSLVCADNPMAYACDVRVFGLRRGRGGNIWDVKRRIGYVSPEMLRSFTAQRAACDIVASGLSDTGRLYRKATDEERRQSVLWLDRLGARHLADRDFLTLSDGERHIVLLARAFVKMPELLILDEPFHGLDPQTRQRARRLIADYTAQHGHTLIIVSHYPQEYAELADREMHLEPCETSA